MERIVAPQRTPAGHILPEGPVDAYEMDSELPAVVQQSRRRSVNGVVYVCGEIQQCWNIA